MTTIIVLMMIMMMMMKMMMMIWVSDFKKSRKIGNKIMSGVI